MNIQKATTEKTEITIPLKTIAPGEVFRFAHDTIEDAFKEDLFWMKMEAPEAKDRVRMVNIKTGRQMERDGDHRCIMHCCTLSVTV